MTLPISQTYEDIFRHENLSSTTVPLSQLDIEL